MDESAANMLSSEEHYTYKKPSEISLTPIDNIICMLEVKRDSLRISRRRKYDDVLTCIPNSDYEENDVTTIHDQRKEMVSEHIDDLLENSSLHGLSYIFDSRYSIRRFIWLVITATAFCYAMQKVYQSTMHYFEYHFTTSRMRRFVDEIEFPAVSLCNLNDMRLSVVRGTAVDKAVLDHAFSANVTAEEYRHVTRSAVHKLEEMLVECIFDGKECTRTNFTEFDWMQGDQCFTFNSGKKSPVLKVRGTGLHRSLMLTINIQHYDYYRDGSMSGIHLILHGHDETPVRIRGPMIPPGFATYIQVEKKKTINLKSPYKTNCGDLKLKYFNGYSMHTCWLEQLTDYVDTLCGCKDFFMPGKIPICNMSMLMLCMWPAWDKFDKEKLYSCPLPCEIDTYYSNSMSRTLFPSASYAHELKDKIKDQPHMKSVLKNVTDFKRFMRNNFLRLIIFYEDLSYERQEQQPSYGTLVWLGDIGGQIGLFIGAGAMSYFEFLDCLALVIYSKFFQKIAEPEKEV